MKGQKSRLLLILAFLVGFIGMQRYQHRLPSERYADVVAAALPETVTIHVDYAKQNPKKTSVYVHGGLLGSGVFITDNGHILTCAHLFNYNETRGDITVETYQGWYLPATLLFEDDKRDLALIKVWDSYDSYARLARPGRLKNGQEVIAIGSPLGLRGTVTTGVISALHKDDVQYDMIQMSAPINPGNSGGPLFNLSGEVVGINTAITTESGAWCGIGWSVSDDEINIFLANFRGLERAIRNR